MGVNYPAQDFNHFCACGVSACLSLSCTASVRLVSLLSPVNPSSPSPPSPRVPSFFSCNVAPLVNLQMPAPIDASLRGKVRRIGLSYSPAW